jgi:hypothetical protein
MFGRKQNDKKLLKKIQKVSKKAKKAGVELVSVKIK